MKNFIKEFFRQRKIKKAQNSISNYGEFKVECVYHDHFIKLMNTVIFVKNNERLDSIPEVYASDTECKTSIKGEQLSLNSRTNGLIKESVLYKIHEEKQNMDIGQFGNIVLKIGIETGSQAAMELLKIFKYIFMHLNISCVNIEKESLYFIIIYGNYNNFNDFINDLLNDNVLSDNKLSNKLVEYLNKIIPAYGTDNGDKYFEGIEDNMVNSILPYNNIFKVQILSHDNSILYNENMLELIKSKNEIYEIQNLYLIIDNPGSLISCFNNITACKVLDIRRYIIKVRYSDIPELINKLNEIVDSVNFSNRDNIISIIQSIIPHEVFEPEIKKEDSEYDNVDEIIN